MRALLGKHRRFFLGTAAAGLALRLLFFLVYPAITDDSRIYADFANNWGHHGVYGRTVETGVLATDSRLPGYPLFLMLIFAVFGSGNFKAVLLLQVALDLINCLVIADLARRVVSNRAALAAFLLAALCPFFANYAATALTETLEILFTSLALDFGVAGMGSLGRNARGKGIALWAGSGVSIGICTLLRPDGGILLASTAFYLLAWLAGRRDAADRGVCFVAAVTVIVGAGFVLVPWTIRNLHTLHRFQPLAPRYATEQNELVPRGLNRWVRTWMADYTSVEEIYWNVPGSPVDVSKLPQRTFDSDLQRQETLQLIADYNAANDLTQSLDARFDQLAAERIRAHSFRYYIELPMLRIADMWLRPRTELMPTDPRWWEFNDVPSSIAITLVFGIANLAYLGAAFWTLVARRKLQFAGFLLVFIVLRSAFLGSLENPETRYTLECYPVVIVLAAAVAQRRDTAEPGKHTTTT